MNIELKPIAESKVRQLGGDVCGVLVRTEGGVMAISEHGRCTRLDAGVMGPVDGAQGGQGAEVVGYLHKRHGRIPCFFESYDEAMLCGCEVVPVYTQPQPAVPEGYPDCDTCGGAMDYMPWHYATETDRHLHACNECWPKVNPATPQADGWVLVPADHLPEVMEKAAATAAREYTARTGGNCMKTIYKALVKAAPQPPKEGE